MFHFSIGKKQLHELQKEKNVKKYLKNIGKSLQKDKNSTKITTIRAKMSQF